MEMVVGRMQSIEETGVKSTEKVNKRKGLFDSHNVIKREEVINELDELLQDLNELPAVLQDNKIKADRLLFKEA